MVLMLDGNSEIGAHDQSKLFDLFKAFDEVKKKSQTTDLISFMRAQHVPSYHFIQVPWIRISFFVCTISLTCN